MLSLLILTFFLVLYSKPALSQWALSQGSRGQFITYSGLISGLFRHPQRLIDQGCPDYTLGPHNRSYLYVGQYPYDANPFFFELYHFASTSTGGIISYTNDSIFNLDFTSIGHPCFKNGTRCGSLVFAPWYYEVAEMLDLGMGTGQRKAVIERVQVGGALGYKVSGDQASFISNGTIKNLVDVARPYGLTVSGRCMDEERYIWNSSFPFSYNLTFTQTSASMSIYSNTTQGTLALSFEGTMNRTDIELYTTDPNVPKFNTSFPSTSRGRESHRIVSLWIYALCILGISLSMGS